MTVKDKVLVISCVTFETVKVVDPAVFYNADSVHLIYYIRDPDDLNCLIYSNFHDKVSKDLVEKGIDVISHNERVSDFNVMLKTILGIMRTESEQFDKVYINISSGTSEYAAAAMFAAIMTPNITPFTVGTSKYSADPDDVFSMFYSDNEPLGLSAEVYNPKEVSTFSIDAPD